MLALYRMINLGHTPVALITTVNKEQKRSWFHGIQTELLHVVSDRLDIPMVLCECIADEYTQAYEEGLKKARQIGADACVFGDIDIDGHKRWNEECCARVGLKCVLPLWDQDREALVREALGAGFKAIIKIVKNDVLDESFLGLDLSIPILERIKAAGADPCGENGEYHTFVYDGPFFLNPVPFAMGEVIDLGTHKAIHIL